MPKLLTLNRLVRKKRMKTVAAVVIDKMAPLDLWGPIQAFQVAFAANPN